ncbi:ABC transporter substrate-binding protein [Massilia sp. CCM 8695]|uniref:ABC transporter substrate-binding protein n=1 Tax=Massilia frigida TaxID=2609281 RepID=A0ABX0ND45_9BURK|nr:ABC transporter substrate-binding protein [Massilia frigida]NHZ83372.1 ABC transporter substrate-binding protein [Massilia frigida]
MSFVCDTAFCFSLVAVLILPVPAAASDVIRMASDDWCPFVCATDGKLTGGYLVDATLQAMGAAGYLVEPILMPLNRAMRETRTGDIEGVYAPPVDDRLRLSAPIAYSTACFYTRANAKWAYRDQRSLAGITVGVIADYGYDDGAMDAYIVARRADRHALDFSHGAKAGTTNLQKMLAGRFLVMLEHEAVVGLQAHKLGVTAQLRQAGCLKQALPLTIGFAREDSRSATWLRVLANGIKHLEASGALRKLRERYAIPAHSAVSQSQTSDNEGRIRDSGKIVR